VVIIICFYERSKAANSIGAEAIAAANDVTNTTDAPKRKQKKNYQNTKLKKTKNKKKFFLFLCMSVSILNSQSVDFFMLF
jgi:hypothetical protein